MSRRGDWSLVMTGFSGRQEAFDAAARAAFGRPGLDTWSLTLRTADSLPAEIADLLPKTKARRIAARLKAGGASIAVLPTEAVGEASFAVPFDFYDAERRQVARAEERRAVRHRAAEAWSQRSAHPYRFTEMDGLICTLAPLNAWTNLRYLRAQDPGRPGWSLERALNHQHPGLGLPSVRDQLRAELEHARELAAALRVAYPERRFVVSSLQGENVVSFYQAGGSAPERTRRRPGPLPKRAWCERCSPHRTGPLPYTRRATPDAAFPAVVWGDCARCGGEVLVRGPELRWVIEAFVPRAPGAVSPA